MTSGPLRHRYGTPRDQIIGVRLATADGRLAVAGGQVVKNVAGYDLGKLVAGFVRRACRDRQRDVQARAGAAGLDDARVLVRVERGDGGRGAALSASQLDPTESRGRSPYGSRRQLPASGPIRRNGNVQRGTGGLGGHPRPSVRSDIG